MLPSLGCFTLKKTRARKALNPGMGEAVWVKADKSVRFKASPILKKSVCRFAIGVAAVMQTRSSSRVFCDVLPRNVSVLR